MPGSHKFELKFLADIEEIIKKFQAALGQMQQMAQQHAIDIRLNYVDAATGKPVGSMFGGMSQGVNVQSNAGTTTQGRMPLNEVGIPIIGPGSGVAGGGVMRTGDPSSAYPSNTGPWDRFRQTDPNYKYLEFERQTRLREDQINILTRGRGGEFLSERIEGFRGKAGDNLDVKTADLIRSISEMKKSFDLATKSIDELTAEQVAAAGDSEKLRDIADKRADLTRIKEASAKGILDVTGGAGGGKPPVDWMRSIIRGIGAEFLRETGSNVIGGPLRALGFRAQEQAPANELLRAMTRMSPEDIVSTLQPDVIASAMQAGRHQAYGQAWSVLTKPLVAAAGGGKTAGGVAALGGAADIGASMWYGGDPSSAAGWSGFQAALSKWAEIKGAGIVAATIAMDRSRGRLPFQETFGATNAQLSAFAMNTGDVNSFYNVGRQFGISEPDQIRNLMAFSRFGGAGEITGMNRRISRMGMAGIDPEFLASQMGRTFAGDASESMRQLEDLMARAMTRGMDNSEIAKRQVDVITSLAAAGGAPGMPADTRLFESAMRMAGNGPMTPDIVQQGMQQIMGERNQRGGLQGLMNAMTAQAVVSRIPGLDPARRAQLTQMLGRYDPSQWGNIISAVGSDFGLSKDQSLAMEQSGMQVGEQFRMRLFGVGGSADPLVNALMLDPSGNAAQVIQTFRHLRGPMAAGAFGGRPEAPTDFEDRAGRALEDSPLIKQMKLLEKNSAELAVGGFGVLNKALTDLAAGGLQKVLDLLQKQYGITLSRPMPPETTGHTDQAAPGSTQGKTMGPTMPFALQQAQAASQW